MRTPAVVIAHRDVHFYRGSVEYSKRVSVYPGRAGAAPSNCSAQHSRESLAPSRRGSAELHDADQEHGERADALGDRCQLPCESVNYVEIQHWRG